MQRDPATHRWQRKQLPRHWRMQTCPVMPLKLLYLQLSHRDSVYNLCTVPGSRGGHSHRCRSHSCDRGQKAVKGPRAVFEYSLDEISNDPITVRCVCVCVCLVCVCVCVCACPCACVCVLCVCVRVRVRVCVYMRFCIHMCIKCKPSPYLS